MGISLPGTPESFWKGNFPNFNYNKPYIIRDYYCTSNEAGETMGLKLTIMVNIKFTNIICRIYLLNDKC